MYLLASSRTNVVFMIIFFLLDVALFLLVGAYWVLAEGDTVRGQKLEIVRYLPPFVVHKVELTI